MKRLVVFSMLVSLFLVFWTTTVSAQVPISLGVRLGANIADVSFSGIRAGSSFSTSTRTGFTFGGITEIGISGLISLQGELLYIRKGANFDFTMPGETSKGTLRYNYLELPVSIKAKVGTAKLKPFIFAGPNLGFNLTAERETRSRGQTETEDIMGETKSVDFAVHFGAGVEYRSDPRSSFFVDIQYSLGLTNIVDSDVATPSEVKTRNVKILIGLLYHL